MSQNEDGKYDLDDAIKAALDAAEIATDSAEELNHVRKAAEDANDRSRKTHRLAIITAVSVCIFGFIIIGGIGFGAISTMGKTSSHLSVTKDLLATLIEGKGNMQKQMDQVSILSGDVQKVMAQHDQVVQRIVDLTGKSRAQDIESAIKLLKQAVAANKSIGDRLSAEVAKKIATQIAKQEKALKIQEVKIAKKLDKIAKNVAKTASRRPKVKVDLSGIKKQLGAIVKEQRKLANSLYQLKKTQILMVKNIRSKDSLIKYNAK